ncbi:MAG: right-handed parallel beta-helix repeat-containing protein [Woeseiaceae bacterium]|nr:right-handed parallel beta-helix repeat-containing protein [Woeseiaceae bacterium]
MRRRSFLSRASLLGLPFFASQSAAASQPVEGRAAPSNVRQFGAVGDGLTDDSAAIQAAVNASLHVYFPAGNYLVRKKIDLRSGSSLVGDGTAMLRTDGTSYILSAVGRIGARRPLRKDARHGDKQILAAASTGRQYQGAGGFLLQSEEIPLGHPTHRAGELGVVSSVNRDEVGVSGLVLADYLLADNAMAAPVTFVEGVSIRGLRLSNDNYAKNPSKVTSALIYLEFVKDFRVCDSSLQRNNSAGISAFNCVNGVISQNSIGQLRDGGRGILGYGVQIGFSSQNITVSGNTISECRHAVTTGTGTKSSRTPNHGVSRALTIVGNSISNCTNAGLDTHEDSDGVTITGNSIIACDPVGIHARSYRSSISNNTITSCTRMGIRISKTAKDTVVSGNMISGIRRGPSGGDGISIESQAVTVTGNRISECDRHGIAVMGDASTDISITGNSCSNNGQFSGGDGINIDRRGPISRLTVVGNTCVDLQTRPTQRSHFKIDPRTTLSKSDCLVTNNNFSSPAKSRS